MKREYPETPLIGVGAIVVESQRILLVKRGHEPLLGRWSIPGGLLEVGETLREAAIREAQEETGLKVQVGELLGVFDRVTRDAEGRVSYHYVLIDFLCKPVGGNLGAAGDADAAEWFGKDELEALGLSPDTRAVIEKALAMERP
jgi:ADP-ribose pyrophosphatase YjhB (NUDIX family)